MKQKLKKRIESFVTLSYWSLVKYAGVLMLIGIIINISMILMRGQWQIFFDPNGICDIVIFGGWFALIVGVPISIVMWITYIILRIAEHINRKD